MDDDAAIEGLTRLGLTSYEARVFLALQKLGEGTASKVSEVSDVPRSQVYGAADGLDERGLVETQQSTPTVYRPVGLELARERLLDQLAETGAETFDYLDSVRESVEEREQSEAIWMVRGSDAVVSRTRDLIRGADERLVYACDDPAMLEGPAAEALEAVADEGIDVVVVSANPAVRDAVQDPLRAHADPHDSQGPDVGIGRVLLADDDTILLSVFSRRSGGEGVEEVAFWSAESTFAHVLVEFLRNWFDDPFAG